MAVYENTNKIFLPESIPLLHNRLASYAGTLADYGLLWGGENPNYLRMETDLLTDVQLNAVGNRYSSLTLATDQSSITADNTDTATITCNDAVIGSDTELIYEIYNLSDYRLDFSGVAPVVGGVASMAFKTAIASRYIVRFARASDHDGYIIITATNGPDVISDRQRIAADARAERAASALSNKDYDQIRTYVINNVTDLPSVINAILDIALVLKVHDELIDLIQGEMDES